MTTNITSQRADLAEAKAMRAKATAEKDKRILKMLSDGVSEREVARAFKTSKSQIERVRARNKP